MEAITFSASVIDTDDLSGAHRFSLATRRTQRPPGQEARLGERVGWSGGRDPWPEGSGPQMEASPGAGQGDPMEEDQNPPGIHAAPPAQGGAEEEAPSPSMDGAAPGSKGITMLGKRCLELDRKPRSHAPRQLDRRPASMSAGERRPSSTRRQAVRRGDEVVAAVQAISGSDVKIHATIGGLELSGVIREVAQHGKGGSQASARKGEAPQAQPSVIVIGAGFAGLAAAEELNALGCKVVVVEARDRVGGRCWTEDLQGRNVDLGAGWIHGVEGNPLAELARRNGAQLHEVPSDTVIHGPDGQPVPKQEDEAVESLFNLLLRKAQDEARNDEVDESLGHKLDKLLQQEGGVTSTLQRQIFQWHCANIEYSTATDIHNLSVRNWAVDDEHAFEGKHCLIVQGYQYLAKSLAKCIDVRLGCEVISVQHSHIPSELCRVSLAGGEELTADTVLVTLPLGVLKSGAVSFDPPLPKRKQDAIQRMGFGLLNKIVLGFKECFWQSATPKGKYIGYAADSKGDFYMFVDISGVAGKPTLMCLVSGSVARALEAQTDSKVKAETMKVVQKITGKGEVPEPCTFCITRWGKDRFSQGSYSYVSVGCSTDDMDALALPLESNKVFFAGEATISEYPSTVHGAFMSGRRAARDILLSWHGDGGGDLSDRVYDVFVSNTADQPNPSSEAMAPMCGLCGYDNVGGREGNMIGPFQVSGQGPKNAEDGEVKAINGYAHEQCALFSPEVGRDRKGLYNLAKAVRRGRLLKCSTCRRPGATIGCQVKSCRVTMHWRCCTETGWNFQKSSEGKPFFCPEHRVAVGKGPDLPTTPGHELQEGGPRKPRGRPPTDPNSSPAKATGEDRGGEVAKPVNYDVIAGSGQCAVLTLGGVPSSAVAGCEGVLGGMMAMGAGGMMAAPALANGAVANGSAAVSNGAMAQ